MASNSISGVDRTHFYQQRTRDIIFSLTYLTSSLIRRLDRRQERCGQNASVKQVTHSYIRTNHFQQSNIAKQDLRDVREIAVVAAAAQTPAAGFMFECMCDAWFLTRAKHTADGGFKVEHSGFFSDSCFSLYLVTRISRLI